MIKLGKVQKLIIKRFASVGAYLNVEDESDDDVLLPKTQVPDDAKIGDEIEVMVYNDSKDRIIATTNRSKLQVGQMGHLSVISQTKIGSFLDWGLEKDLFLPFAETVGKLEKDKEYLVGVYVDKSDRICATMKVRDMLSTDSPYKENDKVKGTIYSINRDIGAFVAVDDKYDGLIPKEELLGAYEVGEIIEVRVTGVKPDGKLDLSFRNRAYIQRDEDSETIISNLKIHSGFLPLNDKSDAEDIRKQLGMSKSAFKKAVGKLYKEQTIIIKDNGIELK